jgi:hypothetical protein
MTESSHTKDVDRTALIGHTVVGLGVGGEVRIEVLHGDGGGLRQEELNVASVLRGVAGVARNRARGGGDTRGHVVLLRGNVVRSAQCEELRHLRLRVDREGSRVIRAHDRLLLDERAGQGHGELVGVHSRLLEQRDLGHEKLDVVRVGGHVNRLDGGRADRSAGCHALLRLVGQATTFLRTNKLFFVDAASRVGGTFFARRVADRVVVGRIVVGMSHRVEPVQ